VDNGGYVGFTRSWTPRRLRQAAEEAQEGDSEAESLFLPSGTDGTASLGMFEQQIQEDSVTFPGRVSELRWRTALVSRRRLTAIEAYALLLAGLASFFATGLAVTGRGGALPVLPVVALAVVAWMAEKQSVQLTTNLQMSVSVLPALFAAVVFGPHAAMAVGAGALAAEFGKPYERWLIWTSTRVLAGGLAGLAAMWAVGADPTFGRLLIAVALAGVIEAVTDAGVGVGTLAIRKSGSISGTLQAMSRLLAGTIPLYTPVLGVLAFSYERVSAWTALLFFVPAVAAQRLFVLYQEQRRLTDDLVVANTSLERANLSFATALVATLDARDQYTAGHSAGVAIYSRDIATRMGLSERECQLAHLAGLVHDIGKVGLPAGLLEKAGPLTLDERRLMETHSEIGERILSNVEDYKEIASIVRHHHERVDGRGYPDRIVGDDIPIVSRIIAVADAYNAMTSDRPYRDAMPSRVARLRLAQAVDSQFDTAVVAAFEAILTGANEDYRLARDPQFSVLAQEGQTRGASLAA
jgi:putative nucleotidyltransferase with HDIG domain